MALWWSAHLKADVLDAGAEAAEPERVRHGAVQLQRLQRLHLHPDRVSGIYDFFMVSYMHLLHGFHISICLQLQRLRLRHIRVSGF